jgi:hypothetical protein
VAVGLAIPIQIRLGECERQDVARSTTVEDGAGPHVSSVGDTLHGVKPIVRV